MNSPPVTIGSSAPAQGPVEIYTIRAVPPAQDKIKLRVAAYARVSTVSEDQLNSFAAQNQYYTALIQSHPHWEFVDLYADKGVTGTSIHLRRDFQRMLSDCRRGNIDRILVKSISRFARNTTECLETLRELKKLGVSVVFEKENIDTGTLSSEMMVSFFASFAQSESETISSNLRWSYRRRMQNGEFITCKAPFGYRLEHGLLRVEPHSRAYAEQLRALTEEAALLKQQLAEPDGQTCTVPQESRSGALPPWSEALIRRTVERVTVVSAQKISVRLKNGVVLEEMLPTP